MAKKTYGHRVTSKGVEIVQEAKLPRHLRGYDEYSVHSFTEGPLKRLLSKRR
jgi:hypothetical protein